MTMSRRYLLLATAATAAFAVVPARAAEPILTDDGLY